MKRILAGLALLAMVALAGCGGSSTANVTVSGGGGSPTATVPTNSNNTTVAE